MSLPRYSVQTQAIYSELLERLQIAELEGLKEDEGSFVRRTIKGNNYWYLRRRIGERINERYALHKLIVAQRRRADEGDKANKDLAQAQVLLGALLEDRPDDLADAWSSLRKRGRTWKSEAMKSLRRLPEELRAPLLRAMN